MHQKFHGKVVLVTGASRGIGRAIAIAFASQGAKLILAARSAEALSGVEREIVASGGEALSVTTDVTSDASVLALVAAAEQRFGRIDVLVNNAGIALVGTVDAPDFQTSVHQTLQASLFGMIRVTQAVHPLFRRQGSGAIVNMSSVMGRKAFARFGSYAIVMHAVSAFSDALRQETAGENIRVLVVHPGLTATDLLQGVGEAERPAQFRYMTPMSPQYVAEQVVRAVHRGARRLILPWQANMLLLGEALSPRIGDAVAAALAIRPIVRLLGMRRGQKLDPTKSSQAALSTNLL